MHKGGHKPLCGLLLVMCPVVHILVAVWVFQDIRMRGAGSGIWIVIALIAGCWERWFTLSYVLVTSKKTDPMTQPGSGEMIVFKPVEKQCRRH